MRLRVGLYDSFWEIPLETITDATLINLIDLVEQGRKRLAEICRNLGDEKLNYILAEEFAAAENLFFVESL